MDTAETFGDRLRKAMKAKRLKNPAVAEAAGVHVNTVSQWLGDRFPPTDDKLAAMAKLLGVSPAWLRFGENGTTSVREVSLVPYQPARSLAPDVQFTSPTTAQQARTWLEEFLLEIAESGADQNFIDSSRRLLLNPANYEHGFGAPAGTRDQMDDEQKLRHMQALAVGVRAALKIRLKQTGAARK